jgi:hypothetical protein
MVNSRRIYGAVAARWLNAFEAGAHDQFVHDPSPGGQVWPSRGTAAGGARGGYTTVWAQVKRPSALATEDFDTGRRSKNFAEFAHPVMGVFRTAGYPIAKLIELTELGKLDLELQRCAPA